VTGPLTAVPISESTPSLLLKVFVGSKLTWSLWADILHRENSPLQLS